MEIGEVSGSYINIFKHLRAIGHCFTWEGVSAFLNGLENGLVEVGLDVVVIGVTVLLGAGVD
jgi:hypothetical protein